MIDTKIQSKEYILQSLTNNLDKSNWIDDFCGIILMRRKAVNGDFIWLNDVIVNDKIFYYNHGKGDMYNLFYHINDIFCPNADIFTKNLIIKDKPMTSRNLQANTILERLHQTISNILHIFKVQNY